MAISNLLGTVLDQAPVGMVLMDRDTRVLHYNRYEETLAGRSREDVVGRLFFDEVAPCTRVSGLADAFAARIDEGGLDEELDFVFPRPNVKRPSMVHLSLTSLEVDGENLGLLTVQDISPFLAVERTKDFLVRTLAHDMASPLTAALFELDSMRGETEPGLREAAVDRTLASLEALQLMHENLFEITRLHSREVPLRLARVDVGEVVNETVSAALVAAAIAEVTINVSLPPHPVFAEFDRQLLSRALANLVENAIRFSPAGESVGVSVEERNSTFVLSVADSGPGVSADLRDSLFEPATTSGGHGHRGLGLALVRLVANEHAGSVTIENPVGGGSIFRVEIPLVFGS